MVDACFVALPSVVLGRTTIAIAGEDYAICAGCTRMSTGYEILSRTQSKLYNLTDETVLLTAGCMTDIIQLRKVPFLTFHANVPRLMTHNPGPRNPRMPWQMFAARVTEYGHRYCFSPPLLPSLWPTPHRPMPSPATAGP